MNTKPRFLVPSFLLAVASLAVSADAPWPQSLYLANHGYWPLRWPVQIFNESRNTVAGEPVSVPATLLAGAPAESVRACDAAGQELLFEVLTAGGAAKHRGPLGADDRIVVPVECGPNDSCMVYLYAGNQAAGAVPDFFRPGLVNGNFEAGETAPDDWKSASEDHQHRLSWESTGGRSGSRCVKAEVDDGAAPTWVQWRQTGIPVVPGRDYELCGWVKAEGVQGRAGWYVHVDGERPQLVNRVVSTSAGTHDWQSVRVRFTAPPTSRAASVGTVLHGTGRAWFDDVSLVAVGGAVPKLRVVPGALEKRILAVAPAPAAAQFSDEWPVRAIVHACNLNAESSAPMLLLVDLRPTLGRWLKIPSGAAVRVVDASSGRTLAAQVRSGNNLLFSAILPAQSIREFHVYLNPRRKVDEPTTLAGYEQLLKDPMNLVSDPSFESGEAGPVGWSFTDARNRKEFDAGFAPDGRFDRRSLRFSVPATVQPNWVGWRSEEIAVRPGATYFLSGFLRSKHLDSPATVHAHWHKKDGALTATSAFLSTHPNVVADSEWTQSSALVQAPADAASIQLHLTLNAHGTLQHDGILFCEVLRADVLRLETADHGRELSGLHIWPANPLIKVFPDDPPARRAEDVTVECARNEFEPFQLVVRSSQPLKNLQVSVSPLQSGKGESLPAVQVDRIGFVPIDHPSGYFRAEVDDWERKMPHGAGATDGWAGAWPDPLLPAKPCDVAARQNQPFWFTVRTLPETAPGAYRGKVMFRADGCEPVAVPVTVTVHPFALPERTQLRAIFDFRFGPGGDYGTGKSNEADYRDWLRLMAAHRLGIDKIEPPPQITYTNGTVRMDATAYDATARFCFDELGMNVSYTPWFFYAFGWAYPPKTLFGLEAFTPEYVSVFQQSYRLFSEHVKAQGWHGRFVYYISDEPHFRHDFIVEQMKKLCALAHEVDPQMPIYSSTWRHCPAWNDSLDIWGVGQYGCFPVSELEELREAGKQFWFTCDGQMATDTPYLATERMLPYYCFKYGATGFEFWGISWWTYDPWETGWHQFIRQSDDGKRHYWVRYPNGDGFLTYPGKSLGVEGALRTIRLEQVREGLEDYEAISLLASLVDRAKRAGRSIAAGERALDRARQLVAIPNAGGLRSTEILPDPDEIPRIRAAVNAAIVAMTP